MSDKCPECGISKFQIKEYERIERRYKELNNQIQRLARDNGFLRWQAEDAKSQNSSLIGDLQHKIRRQSRVITRLEKRLRDVNEQPYKELPTHD